MSRYHIICDENLKEVAQTMMKMIPNYYLRFFLLGFIPHTNLQVIFEELMETKNCFHDAMSDKKIYCHFIVEFSQLLTEIHLFRLFCSKENLRQS